MTLPYKKSCSHVVRVTWTGSIGSRCDYWVQMTSDRWVISCELPADNEINILCYLVIILALALLYPSHLCKVDMFYKKRNPFVGNERNPIVSLIDLTCIWQKSRWLSRFVWHLEKPSIPNKIHHKSTLSSFFHKMIFLYLSFIVNKRRDIRLKTNTDWSNSNNQSFLNCGQGWLGHTMSESAELIISQMCSCLNIVSHLKVIEVHAWKCFLCAFLTTNWINITSVMHLPPFPHFSTTHKGKLEKCQRIKKQISHRSWISWNDSLTPCECRFLMINELVIIF